MGRPSFDAQSNSPWYSILLHQVSVYGVALGYCISLLSIINKWAIMKFPYPGALTALQYFTCASGVVICGWLKLIDLLTMWRFLPAAFMFYISLFPNSELLHANVDTFIVFRSVVPIFVAIDETLFLHQPWRPIISSLSIVSMSIDFVYIKHVVMTMGLNTWGLVLYNNLEALILFPVDRAVYDGRTEEDGA